MEVQGLWSTVDLAHDLATTRQLRPVSDDEVGIGTYQVRRLSSGPTAFSGRRREVRDDRTVDGREVGRSETRSRRVTEEPSWPGPETVVPLPFDFSLFPPDWR